MNSHGWVSIGVIREAIRRLNRAYTALSDEVRQGWWRRLWLGLALVLGLTVVVVWGGRMLEGSGSLAWKRGVLTWLWIREATQRSEQVAAVLLCLLLIGIIALGRLRLGVHWSSDLVAGAVIGGGWVVAVAWATGRAEPPALSKVRGRAFKRMGDRAGKADRGIRPIL